VKLDNYFRQRGRKTTGIGNCNKVTQAETWIWGFSGFKITLNVWLKPEIFLINDTETADFTTDTATWLTGRKKHLRHL